MFILTKKRLINEEIVIVDNEVPRNGHRSCVHPN